MPDRKLRKKKTVEKSESTYWRTMMHDEKYADQVDAAQLDLIEDLNEDFFGISYELVQHLVPLNTFVASKVKRFVDILARLHAYYVDEVEAAKDTQAKVDAANTKLQLAIEASADSHNLMKRLRESLAEAWRTADAVEYREALARNTQVDYTTKENHAKILQSNDNRYTKDMRIRGVVFRERDRLARELKEYQKRLETNRFYAASLEAIILDHRTTIKSQQHRVKQLESDLYGLEHKKRQIVEGLQDKVISQRKELEYLNAVNQDMHVFENKFHETSTLNNNLGQAIDRLSHENYNLMKINHQMDEEQRYTNAVLKNLESTNKALLHKKDELERAIRLSHNDKKKKAEIYMLLNRRFHQLSKKNAEYAEQETYINNELTALEKKLLVTNGQLEDMIRQKEDITRSYKKLQTEMVNHNDAMAVLRHDLVVQRNRMQDVQIQLGRANKMLDDKDIKIHKIKREVNELQVEGNELNKTIESLEGKMARKTEKLAEVREQLEHKHESYLKAKKQMEFVHNEKIMLEKNLDMCGRARQRLEDINGKLSFQINQLCQQLATNEKEIVMQKNRIDQLDNLVKHKQNEIHAKDRQLERMRTDLTEMKMHGEQLQHTIEQDEKRFKQITISLDEVNKEKTLVGQQMVRRNGELRVQQERLAMMQLAIKRGTMQYNQRVDDIRLLKTEITNLSMSNECLRRALNDTSNMRHEVVRLERQLNRERLHVAAFTEEMKYPYRIHRWRVLIGKDPCKYQLIRKIQVLLKRNIRLSVERGNMERRVQDIQRLYDTLKEQLQHMPDPDTVKRLWLQQQINQRQRRKVKAMRAELAINEIDLKSREFIIDEFQQVIQKEQLLQQPNTAIDQLLKIVSVSRKGRAHKHQQVFHMGSSELCGDFAYSTA
ncbi:cilia- and flagella-associated protein 58 isoform X1 [Drosophila montana]|uniref:cilia- and flagella-associated protein 58 isoform X1 n=2 Tax=Drosophila montana TaxID=40370 RepID=UPI00313B5D68